MNRRPVLWALGVGAVVALTWVGLQDQEDPAPQSPAGAPTQHSADSSTGGAPGAPHEPESPADGHDHEHDSDQAEVGEDAVESLDVPVRAEWNSAARRSVARTAEAAMTVYTDHQGTKARWWKRLEPLLTPGARFVYADVPPEQIPATEVTAKVTAHGTDSPLLATATVPTDAGPYELTLTRANGAADWLVDKIVPVEDR